VVRPAEAGDEGEWRRLWSGYCDFYAAVVPEEMTFATWQRILDARAPIDCIVAVLDRETVGFANYVLHPFTWSDRPLCLLEDLFVSAHVRGRGVGNALIQYLVSRGRGDGWARIYWHTRGDNTAARRLYDRFTPADGFIRYTIPLHGPVAGPPAPDVAG
jgi:GNAT superfamily N-acetyltransferase